MTTEQIPATAVVRISTATFDPARYAEVHAMNIEISSYLVPAITALPGLLHFYAGVSPDGSMVHVSVWESDEQAKQLSSLKEMVVTARKEAEDAGATFSPVVHYPVDWTI
ncbi:hypothetical protein ACFYNO_34915 [Kitasatospora sp. NPDC006697]|uniref:hypothetical protein n=1 Tax=Kitasatospora sp. NPDC006697 TaxID=3364020 RepID=UPI003689F616